MEKSKEEILKEREYWYSQTYILLEICKVLQNKELCFLSPKTETPKKVARYMVAFKIDFLKKHFDWINFFNHKINLYHSCANFKENSLPIFSYNLAERTKEKSYQDFNEHYIDYVESYDFFIDMDLKEMDWEKGFAEAKELKKILEKFKVPYYLVNSSKKGFHFCIEEKYMPKIKINKLLETIYNVIYNLKGIYDFSSIDTSITDLKRVKKVPFSYVCDGSICFPLSDTMFENFSEKMVEMQSVLYGTKIQNRGLLTRTYGLQEDELKENVQKFLKEFQ